jgi:hypothetical protein
MEERLDMMIALLLEIRDALCGAPQEEVPTDKQCPCVRAMGVPIANCPFCRGGG